MLQNGKMLKGIRLGRKSVTFNFEIQAPQAVEDGNVIGIDIGIKKSFTASNGQRAVADIHGHTLESIQNKLSRCQKGSKGFARAQEHRLNYINWSINQLNLDNIKLLRIENIKDLRRGKRTSRRLSSWIYPTIRKKLEERALRRGVQVVAIEPTYTSQRCACCGMVKKSNRKGESFCCSNCGHTADADYNAACNIQISLPPLPKGVRDAKPNRTGFFWREELIVPQNQKSC